MRAILPDLGSMVAAVAASAGAPLSARQALFAAAVLDQVSDAAFAGRSGLPPPMATAADILTFRAALRGLCPAMGAMMDLVEGGAAGPRLQVAAVKVPEDGFGALPVADLMVSLYNAGTVPRLVLVRADGSQDLMQDLLQQAAAWWQSI